MGWRHEITINSWRPNTKHVIGEDLDGDIGIADERDYSIIIHADEAAQLRDWLNEFIERRKQRQEANENQLEQPTH